MFLQYYRSISTILLLSAFQICDLQAIKPVGLSKNDKTGPTKKNILFKKLALSALGAGIVLLPCGLFLVYKIKNNGTQESTQSSGPGPIAPALTPTPQLPSRNPVIVEPKTQMERWVYASTLTDEEKDAFRATTGLSWDGLFNPNTRSRYPKARIVPGTRRCAKILEALEFCKEYKPIAHATLPYQANNLSSLKAKASYELWSKLARECVIGHITDKTLFDTKIEPIKTLCAAVNQINSDNIPEAKFFSVNAILREIIAKAQPGACPTIERDFPPLTEELRKALAA